MGRAVAGPGGDVDLEPKLITRLRQRGWPPATAVAQVAERLANRGGASLVGSGFRLFETHASDDDAELDVLLDAERAPGVAQLGRLYEQLLAPSTRRRTALHVTPADIAGAMVARLRPGWLDGLASGPVPAVFDPAVGGGVFLLAAADALVVHGARPCDVLAALHGLDVDPDAVGVAEAALGLWAIGRGVEPEPIGLAVGDGLLDDLPTVDVIIGNPPFLNQLRSASAAGPERRNDLRERWGDLVGAYTDEVWLFLAAAAEAAAAGGQISLVQPISVLAARHGAEVRSRLADRFHMAGLWIADGPVFDVSVEVCAPFFVERDDIDAGESTMRRWSGTEFDPHPPVAEPGPGDWGRAGAGVVGIPSVRLGASTGVLADVATATAGFRDQFYGLAPHVVEAPSGSDGTSPNRLVTVGMIDPFHLRWGEAAFRFAGSRYVRPIVDLAGLAAADSRLAEWVEARCRPKVVMATQTRVVEAVVDRVGDLVPATPVISVEPVRADDLYAVAAVMMAPVLAVEAAAQTFGTALSVRAIKLAASQVLRLPLPVDEHAWNEGTRLAEDLSRSGNTGGDDMVVAFAEAMNAAYGVTGSTSTAIASWWVDRWPRRAR